MPGKGHPAKAAPVWQDPGLPVIDHTLDDLLRRNAALTPEKPALVFYGTVKTYGQLDREVTALAGYLQRVCGVAKGDRVGLMMQNAPQFVVGTYAIVRVGGIVVPLNVMNQTAELEVLATHAGMGTVLTAEDMVARLSPLLGKGILRHLVVARYADETDTSLAVPLPQFITAAGTDLPAGAVSWSQALSSGMGFDPVAIAPTDLCIMPYTAGSTGQPKGCMHSHVSVLSAVRCMTDWFHFGSDDVFLAAAPMFHVVGLQAGMNAAMALGGTSVILPRWDRDVAATLIRDFHVTAWPTVPTAVIDFLGRPDIDRHDLASLRVLWGGGSAMPEAIAKKLFDLTGLRFIEGYGMTETMAPSTTNPLGRPKDQCAGLPAIGTLIRLIDPETHRPTPAGEVGEVVISGPQVMQGYWQNPEATAEAFITLDGHRFLRSGDLGRLDDEGYLYIVDRLKRMINASGFKVWPSEVETKLYAHPAIHDVCIIAARDPYRGETVKAVAVLKPGASLTVDALQTWARDHMAAYKIPRLLEIVDALPKSGAGKVLWRDLQSREDARASSQPTPAHQRLTDNLMTITHSPIQERRDGTISILTMNDGGSNLMSLAMRVALYDALTAAEADADVTAVLLMAEGATFSAGADLNEMDTGLADCHPNLAQLVYDFLPSLKVPVVAAVQGLALGGALEVALACHHRLFAKGAKIGLPEVSIGLLPGAGGTQLLPRAIGLEAATNMILSARPLPAAQFADTALCSGILGDDALQDALAYARRLTRDDRPDLGSVRVDHPSPQAFLQSIRTNLAGFRQATPGHALAVDCLEAAATLPLHKGRVVEREKFNQARVAEESPAYRYGFAATRKAGKVAAIRGVAPRALDRVAIIGAGVMGQGIALACAEAGLEVRLLDSDPAGLARASRAFADHFNRAVHRGKMTEDKARTTANLIACVPRYDDLATCNLAIEAVVERMEVKHAVFAELDRVLPKGAILASNTSTLDLNRIAAATSRPGDVLGLHFFNPAHVMKLMEIVRTDTTQADVLATGFAFAKRLRKEAVLSGVCDGFIGNRMVEQYLKQALFLVEEGASPAQVDRALERWGMAMGPLRMMDLAGNDVNDAIRARKRAENPGIRLPDIPDILRDRGWKGQKSGLGWYDYTQDPRKPQEHVALSAALSDWRKAKGLTPRKITEAEIIDRLILSLVNEAAHLLGEGIAQRGSDVDVVYLTGYGFPAGKGGPLYHADRIGLRTVMRRMQALADIPHGDPAFWSPTPLLARLAGQQAKISEFEVS